MTLALGVEVACSLPGVGTCVAARELKLEYPMTPAVTAERTANLTVLARKVLACAAGLDVIFACLDLTCLFKIRTASLYSSSP